MPLFFFLFIIILVISATSLLGPIFTLIVRQQPRVAVVIVMGEK